MNSCSLVTETQVVCFIVTATQDERTSQTQFILVQSKILPLHPRLLSKSGLVIRYLTGLDNRP